MPARLGFATFVFASALAALGAPSRWQIKPTVNDAIWQVLANHPLAGLKQQP